MNCVVLRSPLRPVRSLASLAAAAAARLTPAGWRIVEERLDSPLRVVIPKTE